MECVSVFMKNIFLLPLFLLLAYTPLYFYEVSIQVRMRNGCDPTSPERQSNLTGTPPAGYVVYTDSCKIFDLPAFSWEAFRILKPEPISCPESLISKIGN
ncbi:unnamed protein product, partial [Allacma fusca]